MDRGNQKSISYIQGDLHGVSEKYLDGVRVTYTFQYMPMLHYNPHSPDLVLEIYYLFPNWKRKRYLWNDSVDS